MQFADMNEWIAQFTASSALNRVEQLSGMMLFDRPLVGIAHAQDSLFEQLKAENAVGPQHMSPIEWLPEAEAVLVYFLPFTEAVRKANRSMGVAAKEWMHGRIEGEQFNNALRDALVQRVIAAGYKAVAPARDSRFGVINRRSKWSERHAAFVAGLGTFSLSRSLITERGSAGRIGSIIVDIPWVATPRRYEAIDEYCSKCKACIVRCPPLAITEQGKDNAICSDYLDRVLSHYKPYYGCGKCQTGVPCEGSIPGSC